MPTAEQRAAHRRWKRAEQAAETHFAKAHNAAASYGAALRRYARSIHEIIQHFVPRIGTAGQPELIRLREALGAYGAANEPWARRVTGRMVAEVSRRNLSAWKAHSGEMSRGLQVALQTAPIGLPVATMMGEQVELIKSMPVEAGQWVHEQVQQALVDGERYAEVTAREAGYVGTETWAAPGDPRLTELGRRLQEAQFAKGETRSLEWLMNRATLIARTETARANSVLTQARAEHVGAEQYIWKTAGDARVRENHRRLNNTVQSWSDPPESDPPLHSHPGAIFNCRCIALPIIPS
jgi:SPP1 gp7 family putative phage head morphogenesis protein